MATSPIDLTTYVAQGLFSKDLYEYLSDSIIALPALKERKDKKTDDVLLLAGYFLEKYAQGNHPLPTISNEARSLLQTYDFPGNVWELEEAIRVALIKAKSDTIEPHHLPERIQNYGRSTKLIEVIRKPLPENIVCPHDYSLIHQADTIAQVFDTENYVYLSVGADVPAWYQSAVVDVLTQFGLKLYEATKFSLGDNFCPICQPILSCYLAILDISTLSPIVFYKLGLAHTMGLLCVILKKKGSPVSGELGDLNMLEYHDEASLKKSLRTWLNHLISLSETRV